MRRLPLVLVVAAGCSTEPRITSSSPEVRILDASFDATRELYAAENAAFAARWQARTGQHVTIEQAHARLGEAGARGDRGPRRGRRDARARLRHRRGRAAGLIDADWARRLPDHAAPFTSTIVFLVRKGNPKRIADWDDLVRDGVEVITPNPRTSGGARWNYLAAWGAAARAAGGDQAAAREFVRRLYAHVPVLDSGARGATTTFVERGIGDVLLAWESEARRAIDKLGPDRLEIVMPSVSIVAETPVAWSTRSSIGAAPARSPPRTSSSCTRPKDRRSRRAGLPPARSGGGTGAAVPTDRAVHDRRGVRRLDPRAGRALRRRRRVRPARRAAVARDPRARPARVRADDGVHAGLPVADRPDPARHARGEDLGAVVGAALGPGDQRPGARLLSRHVRRVVDRRDDQRRVRDAAGLGARALPVPRARRDRRDRRPPVRAADRGRPASR